MKRTVNIASILLIVLSGVIFVYLFRAANTASANTATANALAFAAFPINEPRLINFDVNREALADRSPREKLDQSRDWLLYAVLSESGKSVKDLSEMLYDLPATRSGYMHQVANFEYGETRSRFIGDGQVVALIPAGNNNERLPLSLFSDCQMAATSSTLIRPYARPWIFRPPNLSVSPSSCANTRSSTCCIKPLRSSRLLIWLS